VRRNRPTQAVRDSLAALGVPFGPLAIVEDIRDALEVADRIGYPVVAKVVCDAIVHKTDAGLVAVGLASPANLMEALQRMGDAMHSISPSAPFQFLIEQMSAGERELLVGARRDDVFGIVAIVGMGGVDVEVHDDVCVRIAPASDDEVLQMFAELRSAPLLFGHRNRCPVDLHSVVPIAQALVRHLEQDQHVVDVELNPVLVRCSGDGAVVVDARSTEDVDEGSVG